MEDVDDAPIAAYPPLHPRTDVEGVRAGTAQVEERESRGHGKNPVGTQEKTYPYGYCDEIPERV